jgi:hypothetical protein
LGALGFLLLSGKTASQIQPPLRPYSRRGPSPLHQKIRSLPGGQITIPLT